MLAEPSLSWYASATDYDKEDTYTLKFKMIDSYASTVLESPFVVDVIDNPCIGSWSSVPADGDIN